ncbi:MAG TPA: dethiobiotin synthase [Sneathiellales bacterium]|jgi:dethiobiotin synthetase|nr:dethiobiotin synthase [Sneathiellales bacterium]
MKTFFVTSSGTEIGKTLVTAALCHQLRQAAQSVEVLKPVVSNFHADDPASDTAILLAALGKQPTSENIEHMSPWRFTAPLSPHMAAAREGRSIDFDALVAHSRAAAEQPENYLLIEGVGGVMVPLTSDKTVRDWMAAVGAPVLLVVGSYLGTISHTLSAADALLMADVPLKAVIVSTSEESPVPAEETAKTLSRFLAEVPVVTLPRLTGYGPELWKSAPDLTGLLLPT